MLWIGQEKADELAGLLRAIAEEPTTAPDMGRRALTAAQGLNASVSPADLAQVALVLVAAADANEVSAGNRESARRWTKQLEQWLGGGQPADSRAGTGGPARPQRGAPRGYRPAPPPPRPSR